MTCGNVYWDKNHNPKDVDAHTERPGLLSTQMLGERTACAQKHTTWTLLHRDTAEHTHTHTHTLASRTHTLPAEILSLRA